MANRVFEVAFRINGALSGQFASAMRNAQNSMRNIGAAARAVNAATNGGAASLQNYLARLNQISASAQKFAQLKRAVSETSAAMLAANQNVARLARQYRDSQAAATALKSRLDVLKATLEAQKNSMPRNELRQLRAEIKSVTAEYRAANNAAKAASREFESAKNKAAGLKTAYQQQRADLQSLRSALSAAGFSTQSFASSERNLRSEIESTTRAIERQAQVQSRLSAAQSRSQTASGNLGMAAAGVAGAVYTAEQVAAPFQSAVENAMTFEHAMSRVKALTQTQFIREGDMETVRQNMARLENQARELGATTQFTMTQAADAMGYLGMAGWKTEQIYNSMPGMLNLAAGAGTDLARTADIVSDNMTAMGIQADSTEKVAHFMDVYAYALTNSNVNLESLGESMKYAAPVAAAFGATLEDTAAMTMMMGNAGIKGSMAGTALRMGLLRLSGPPKKASKEMEALGISVSDATAMAMEAQAEMQRLGISVDENAPPMEKMGQIIRQLQGKMQGLTREEKLASIGAIFGANAASGWVNIIEQGPEVFEKYVGALRNCDGYSKMFAQTMNDDTRGAMIALESALDAVQNSIGSALLPAVRQAAEWFAPLATSAANFIKEHPRIVQAAAGIAAAFSVLLVGAAAVKLAFAGWGFITAQIELVKAAMLALSTGTGTVGAMFAAMRARIVTEFAIIRGLTWSAVATSIKTSLSGAFTAVATRATLARTAVTGFFRSMSLSGILSGAATAIRSVGTAFLTAGRAALVFALSPVGVALMAIGAAAYFVYQNWDRLAPVFSNIAGILGGALKSAIDRIKPAIETLGTAFSACFKTLSENGALQTLMSTLGQIASIVGGVLVGAFIVLLNVIVGVISTGITILSTIVTTVMNVGSEIINFVSNVLAGNWRAAWENLKNIVVEVFSGLKDIITAPFDGIIDTVKNIGESLNIFQKSGSSSLGMGGLQAANAAATVQPAQVDTSTAQAGLDELGNSAQPTAEAIAQLPEGFQNVAQQLQDAGQLTPQVFQQIQQAAQPVADGMTNLAAPMPTLTEQVQQSAANFTANNPQVQQSTANFTANNAQVQASTAAMTALNSATTSATSSVTSMGSAASSTASAFSGLAGAVDSVASALSSKAAEIGSIHISVPTVSQVASNAEGGIYGKGAFLTTFAETSPEAAIPIDNSKRAKNLWQQVGQMLGILPKELPVQIEQPPIQFPPLPPGFNPDARQPQPAPVPNQKPQFSEKVRQSRTYQNLMNRRRTPRAGAMTAPGGGFGGIFDKLQSTIGKIFGGGSNLPQTNIPTGTPPTFPPIPTTPPTFPEQNKQPDLNLPDILSKIPGLNLPNLNLPNLPDVFGGIFGGGRGRGKGSMTSGGGGLSGILGGLFDKIGLNLPVSGDLSGGLNSGGISLPEIVKNVLSASDGVKNGAPENFAPNINISVTIQGNANEETMQQAGQTMTFELRRQLDEWWNTKVAELKRRSFS